MHALETRFKLALISAIPSLMMALLLLLSLAIRLPDELNRAFPLLHLAPVYLWAVLNPREMRVPAVLLAGLFTDIATGLPLGVSALAQVGFLLLVRSQRKYIHREGFAVMWGYFGLLLLAMQLFLWGVMSIYGGQLMPVRYALLQWVISLLAYPLLHFFIYPWVERLSWRRTMILHHA